METEKLIRASEARKAILDADPKLAYCIDSIKAVDAVEVVHGRWIEKIDMVASYLAGCEELFYECSVCNAPNFGESPYCPNCGANMMDGWNEDG